MQLELYQHINNYSIHTRLTSPESDDINKKKSERVAMKDSEWPELHTITVAGYIHNQSQFGFDGYDEARDLFCEVKSSSKIINKDLIKKFSTGLITKRNEFVDHPIDGRGMFSLLTHDAYQRYLNHDVNMLISAYINGVLMFIIEFPFSHPPFKDHVKRILEKSLPNGDKPGRSKTVSFAYSQYKDCKDAKLIFVTTSANMSILKGACTKNFYNYLLTLQNRALPQTFKG